MTRTALVVAALATTFSLASIGSVCAQDQNAAPAQPAPSASGQSADTGSASKDQKAPRPGPSSSAAGQPDYAPKPLPDDSSGVYLPGAVGGYVRSSVSCVVVGCDDGPDVKAPPSSAGGAAEPPPGPTQGGPAGALGR